MKSFLPALLTCLSAPVLASVGASASLTGLRYELVDLDLNDGITPAVKFTGQSLARVKNAGYCIGCKAIGSFTAPASVTFSDGSAAVSQEGLFAFSGSGSASLAAADFPDLSPRRYVNKAVARYEGVPGMPLFQLSAHTGLRITGQYTLAARVDPFRNPPPLLRRPESGTAGVFFISRFLDGDSLARSITARSDWQSAPDQVQESGEISVLLRNDLDHQATLWGRWGVVAMSAVPGIPEPSTYALMLAGTGLISVIVRRQRVTRRKAG
ncbi:PEP-CTERM sorting domain-containing protein [Azohydromonas aeria]|uniref:PEP-CTERM sorting domain-containing protein n=1 Tax=Azohydromonas aeria TaxID=2590212 RepID=UPI0012FBFD4D|nr:PEP-CTERM sorting domain-containing protein [Azohydromonas aeria]